MLWHYICNVYMQIHLNLFPAPFLYDPLLVHHHHCYSHNNSYIIGAHMWLCVHLSSVSHDPLVTVGSLSYSASTISASSCDARSCDPTSFCSMATLSSIPAGNYCNHYKILFTKHYKLLSFLSNALLMGHIVPSVSWLFPASSISFQLPPIINVHKFQNILCNLLLIW